jgi:hypothetical protein
VALSERLHADAPQAASPARDLAVALERRAALRLRSPQDALGCLGLEDLARSLGLWRRLHDDDHASAASVRALAISLDLAQGYARQRGDAARAGGWANEALALLDGWTAQGHPLDATMTGIRARLAAPAAPTTD